MNNMTQHRQSNSSTLIQSLIAVLLLGLALGVGGYHLYQTRVADQTSADSEAPREAETGLTNNPISELGVRLQIRPTDKLAIIQGEQQEAVGVRVFDPLTGDVNTGPHVDVITVRQTKQDDQPDAKSLDDYKQPAIDGLTIKETKELTIDGHAALKQLYEATVEVPGPLGSTQQQQVTALRWVIEREPGTYVIVRSAVTTQGLLDLVAQKLSFIPIQAAKQATSATENGAADGSSLSGGDDPVIDISGATLTPQNSGTTDQTSPSSSAVPIQ